MSVLLVQLTFKMFHMSLSTHIPGHPLVKILLRDLFSDMHHMY